MAIELPTPQRGEDSLQFLAAYIRKAFSAVNSRLQIQFREDYVASGDPFALDLQSRGLLLPYVAFSFAPADQALGHVGCILVGDNRLSVGLHLTEKHIASHREALETLRIATCVTLAESEAVKELQCNLPEFDLERGGLVTAAASAALFCSWLSMMQASEHGE
ncbi:hypothetical protein [Bosea massiliensis]|uniref:Uncharacterized protein n=1 Tax=Bosea massiliensis TaxID=151419 RepID=A0ABW0PCV8_9HYPH